MRIRSLYARMVITFILVVVVSLMVSLIITRLVYGQQVLERLQQDSLIQGKQIVRYILDNPDEDAQTYLESPEVPKSYNYKVYRKIDHTDEGDPGIQLEQIEHVMRGGVYRSEISWPYFYQDEVVIGLPFEVGNQHFALFVSPDIKNMFREFDQIFTSLFIVILVIGSILILISSRYLVTPIRSIIQATEKIAQGNYQVNLRLNREDELGMLAKSFNHMVGELKQIEQMRQDFVSDVSHEIQSPLTSIRGFSLMLLNEDANAADRKRYLQIIAIESERLSKLTDNLLKLASLDSDHHPLHMQTYRLDEQLRQAVIHSEPLWREKQLTVKLELNDSDILADRDQLMQVWTNIMSNCIKFSKDRGHIEIQLRRDQEFVVIHFTDQGIGISDEAISHIFQRFYKWDTARNRTQGGSGLGLAIAHKIISLHHGTIHVTSKLGQWTTLEIKLPVPAKNVSHWLGNQNEG